MKASEILRTLPPQATPARDRAVLDLLDAAWLRTSFVEVPMPRKNGLDASIYVSPDYFALGEVGDAVRMPLGAYAAQALADAASCMLPTPAMVDAIWRAAAVRLTPLPSGSWRPPRKPGGSSMMSTDWLVEHSRLIDRQLAEVSVDPAAGEGTLVAGHKKDVVLSNALEAHPGNVCIYGWPWPNGVPIQGVNAVSHEGPYCDYSHGIRLVSRQVIVNGAVLDLEEALADAAVAPCLNYDGILRVRRYTRPPAPPARVVPAGDPTASTRSWQTFLKAQGIDPGGIDGDFGRLTHAATRAFQVRYLLPQTGELDEATKAAARAVAGGSPPPRREAPAPLPDREGDLDGVPFVPARWYTPTGDAGREIHGVCLHTAEMPEKGSTAEDCARFFAGGTREASATLCIDANSEVQCVRLRDVPWAAPGANRTFLHIEHAGFARQTAAEWHDAYSDALLSRSARRTAQLSQLYGFPLAFVDAEGLLRDERGVTTHAEVTKACKLANERKLVGSPFYNKANPHKPLTDHTDPGENFPMDDYLARARAGT